ncbi:MAG TPA: CDP-glucose 4,6-dehydratase, partial [Myxococcales bacterium]|nr:CDP-glucose 4,6-dehydratase [Myxococcales bacterium]
MSPPAPPDDAELRAAYQGKRVLLTGHTGFKGGWLALWLAELGAQVTGFALPPDTEPSFFNLAGVGDRCRHVVGDVRDPGELSRALSECSPHYVFHLAAQSLVRRSYERPIETLQTNVMGTAHLLEAIRQSRHRCALVVVTSDKCYENREWLYGYREHEPMGGHDVYSMSKGAAELLVASYRRSFFPPERLHEHGVALATARAGNVIGGGDWAPDRLVPDVVQALVDRRPVPVRNPGSVRPWQHVLEPAGAYLLLGARLAGAGTAHPEQF